MRSLLLTFAALFCVGAVVGGGGWLLYGSDLVRLEHVRVVGNARASEASVRPLADLAVGEPLVAQDQHPAIGADQEVGPERDGDQKQPQRFARRINVERHEIGHRKGQQHRHRSNRQRHEQRPDHHHPVQLVGPGFDVIGEGEGADDLQVAIRQEAVDENQCQRGRQQQDRIDRCRADHGKAACRL
jgi:hypothetical protein